MSEAALKTALKTDLRDSMRAKDKIRTATLRMALSAVTNAEVAGSEATELSDADVLAVLSKEAKKRKEAAAAYRDGGRPELADQEEAELAVLETYLPQQLDDAQIEKIVAEVIEQSGASGLAQMGQVMRAVQAQVAGQADGGRVAAIVKSALASAT